MEYRAIVKYATEGSATVTLRSDWVPHQDTAREVVEQFDTSNQWGEIFETNVECKTSTAWREDK